MRRPLLQQYFKIRFYFHTQASQKCSLLHFFDVRLLAYLLFFCFGYQKPQPILKTLFQAMYFLNLLPKCNPIFHQNTALLQTCFKFNLQTMPICTAFITFSHLGCEFPQPRPDFLCQAISLLLVFLLGLIKLHLYVSVNPLATQSKHCKQVPP